MRPTGRPTGRPTSMKFQVALSSGPQFEEHSNAVGSLQGPWLSHCL